MLAVFTEQLKRGESLVSAQTSDAVNELTEESLPVEIKADFLAALSRKGETVEEISAFASALRAKSIAPPLDAKTRAREILDVCGTGGDHLGTFNISTTVALICAAAGVAVAKHGNRAITSKTGSADVIEALGIKIDLPPAEAVRSLRERNFAFFYAPNYHPAFQHITPARKLCANRGQRTIFNFLGPLLNPARPSAQLLGVPRVELCEPMARVLQTLGVRRGMVVSGEVTGVKSGRQIGGLLGELAASLDELSTLGANTIAEFYQERGFAVSTLDAGQFPLQPVTLNDLLGGDRQANAEIIRRILCGDERGPKRDAVLLNAGAALFVAGRSTSFAEGWELAAATIDGGAAEKKLAELTA